MAGVVLPTQVGVSGLNPQLHSSLDHIQGDRRVLSSHDENDSKGIQTTKRRSQIVSSTKTHVP